MNCIVGISDISHLTSPSRSATKKSKGNGKRAQRNKTTAAQVARTLIHRIKRVIPSEDLILAFVRAEHHARNFDMDGVWKPLLTILCCDIPCVRRKISREPDKAGELTPSGYAKGNPAAGVASRGAHSACAT